MMAIESHAVRQKALYEEIWSKDQSYGTAAKDVEDTVEHRILPHLRRLYIGWRALRVVDFGAGDGRFLRALEPRWPASIWGAGVDVYEPVEHKGFAWFKQPMWEPLNQTFDYAISTDALEHLPPGMIFATLRNIAASAPHGFLRISLTEDHYGTERGLHLHETVWPGHIWLLHLAGAGIKTTSYRVYLDDNGADRALEVWF